jgi:hypothetical protein
MWQTSVNPNSKQNLKGRNNLNLVKSISNVLFIQKLQIIYPWNPKNV